MIIASLFDRAETTKRVIPNARMIVLRRLGLIRGAQIARPAMQTSKARPPKMASLRRLSIKIRKRILRLSKAGDRITGTSIHEAVEKRDFGKLTCLPHGHREFTEK
jgi:hypothetical protein